MSIHGAGLGPVGERAFAAVLFDLDGTLIDSTPIVERSWRRWASELGLGDDFVVPHGIPGRQVVAGLVPPEQVEAAFRRIEAIEMGDVDDIVILPGAVAALSAIPHGRAAIATSGSAPLAAARLAATGLPAPDVVVTADDVVAGKPHPEPYLLAARRLGVDPAHCLVVEDAPAGLAAGRAAGCRTLAVATTHLRDGLDADAVVGGLDDVVFTVTDAGIVVAPADCRTPDVGSAP